MIFDHDHMSKIRCRFPGPPPIQGASVARGRIVSLPDVVGLVGVLAYLHAYALAQLQILAITDWRTALLNIVGGLLVMYSLLWSFNLASFVAQAFWMLFTVIGLVKARRMRAPTPGV
jgi:hypothetical protein